MLFPSPVFIDKMTLFGLGLRHNHHKFVLQNNPKIDFFEIHTENFIADGGASIEFLSKIAKNYPLSFHSVGLSLGSAEGVNKNHLRKIRKLVDEFKPVIFSDHLSWSGNSKFGFSHDLLPIPYNQESLSIFIKNINEVQQFLGRKILIENPSNYLEFERSDLSETEFLNLIVKETDCSILLDLNNIFVGSVNFNFDAKEYIKKIDLAKVAEIHLAGHSTYLVKGQEFKIDTHSTNICDEVFQLYRFFLEYSKLQIPTLIEWDEEIPEFEVLNNELDKAKKIYNEVFS